MFTADASVDQAASPPKRRQPTFSRRAVSRASAARKPVARCHKVARPTQAPASTPASNPQTPAPEASAGGATSDTPTLAALCVTLARPSAARSAPRTCQACSNCCRPPPSKAGSSSQPAVSSRAHDAGNQASRIAQPTPANTIDTASTPAPRASSAAPSTGERALGTDQSKRPVPTARLMLNTEANTANVPKSAGAYSRVSSGAASTGSACASTLARATCNTFRAKRERPVPMNHACSHARTLFVLPRHVMVADWVARSSASTTRSC